MNITVTFSFVFSFVANTHLSFHHIFHLMFLFAFYNFQLILKAIIFISQTFYKFITLSIQILLIFDKPIIAH